MADNYYGMKNVAENMEELRSGHVAKGNGNDR
jgi:hypothetical protein